VEGQDLETNCEDGKQQQSKALCVASTSTSNYNPQQNVKSARNVPRRNYKEDPEPDDDDDYFCKSYFMYVHSSINMSCTFSMLNLIWVRFKHDIFI
jgi:hypothetical protein